MSKRPASKAQSSVKNLSQFASPPTKLAKMATPMEIDEDLHSRQLAVYGRESMHRMSQASVLVVGAGGLGVEIGEYLKDISAWLRGLTAYVFKFEDLSCAINMP